MNPVKYNTRFTVFYTNITGMVSHRHITLLKLHDILSRLLHFELQLCIVVIHQFTQIIHLKYYTL